MSIDMSQFHQAFFEESFEGLDAMESGLLDLNMGTADEETINTIFRAAHSMKGGSGTFGFSEIADFTHHLETLLDQMRSGEREASDDVIQLLLQSVDCLRGMLAASRDKQPMDFEHIGKLQHELEQCLEQDTADSNVTDTAVSEQTHGTTGWRITFRPYTHLFLTGNDPLRMFRELGSLGHLAVQADITSLPPFADLDPEESYLGWELELESDCSEAEIRELFDWVEGDCDLAITPVSHTAGDVAETQVEQALPVDDTAQVRSGSDRRRGQDRRDNSAERRRQELPIAGRDRRSGSERRAGTNRRSGSDRRNGAGESSSIRVGIDKIDALINMVGELVITQSMLSQVGENFDLKDLEKLRDGLGLLERNTRELQENVMRIRMLPISFSFNRFPRLVHDLTSKFGKKVDLKLSGEQTELDKTVMEKIGDPLVHLVRNSLDHGIESPELRRTKGKAETGTIRLNAYHEGGNIVIEISDDGAGLDTEKILQKGREQGLIAADETPAQETIHNLIFQAGLSTADAVTDVSGRGVGMDVVRRNIRDLGGSIEVRSEKDRGSTFTIRLPLTLAILDGQLIKVGEQTYIIPLVAIVESLQIESRQCSSIVNRMECYRLRDDYIPVVRLHKVFGVSAANTRLANGLLVVVEAEGQKAGLFVDDLLAQQQVVIKSLESNYQKVTGISGATILGDGTVALILDISGLISLSRQKMSESDLAETDLKVTDTAGVKAA
ncbi:MAG: chemotaxis protein CheA [Gammaproteobacteria bacterium]